ncbi:TPA: alpha/beta fold hydrolase, partial [Escherichia coli]
ADSLQMDKFVLGGMSMGGYISLRFALSHSERLSGLILMATQAEQDPPEIASSYMELCNGWQDPFIKENIISSLLPVFFGNNVSEAETWRQVWLGHKPENIRNAMNAMLERDDISERIQIITTPTLIIHGANDLGIPLEKAIQMHKMIAHSKLEVIPDANHALNITHAKEVNIAIKNWLQITQPKN